ncbi:uridine kinase [Candidatus Scalindua japonica]|uniref:Uridine kinase n=2 Tax=Candidatus Scalindua japonica TaxID=1284222 RepID=A0A286U464_9BACT|nr:uridine kinase [Candidatus Scalindua japonica]
MDCYYRDLSYLSLNERHRSNFDHPDAIDYELFREHLEVLISGGVVYMPLYDFHTHTRSVSREEIQARGKVILVDGLFALYWSEISKLYDLKVFINLDSVICLQRRIKRDVQYRGRSYLSVKKQYYKTVLPMYEKYIAPTQYHADLSLHGDMPVQESVRQMLQAINAISNEGSI